MDRPGLLHILVEIVVNLALFTRAKVLHIKLRLGALAVDISEISAVRRRRRAHSAAWAASHIGSLARLEIVTLDREDLLVGILGIFEDIAGSGVAAEIDGIARRREHRLAELFLEARVRPLDKRNARAAGHVVHPYLAGSGRALSREMLARRDEAAVGAPGRVVEKREGLFGELPPVGAVDVHNPDVLAAAPIGGEGNLPAVR